MTSADASPEQPISRGEMLMVRRAFRNRWGVSADKRRRIVARLQHVIDDPKQSARDRPKAVETLGVVYRAV